MRTIAQYIVLATTLAACWPSGPLISHDANAVTGDVTGDSTAGVAQLGPWRSTVNVPSSHTTQDGSSGLICLAASNTTLYAATATNTGVQVWRTTVHDDGTIEGWTAQPIIPMPMEYGTAILNNCAVGGGYLYVTGMYVGLYRAPIAADGTLGTFTVQQFPVLNAGDGAFSSASMNSLVAYHGYLYLLGSDDNGPGQVAYGQIAADGTVAWRLTSRLGGPGTEHNPLTITPEGDAYVVGGAFDGAENGAAFYAHVGGDGSLGVWNHTTSLPDPGNRGYYDGCITSIAGTVIALDGSQSADPAVYLAPTHPDGVLASWIPQPPIPPPQGLTGAGCTIAHGYVYVAGGDSVSVAVNTVYYAKLE